MSELPNTPELRKTPLYSLHQAAGAMIVDFGGWALPVNYGSQIEEHQAVREDCGMFDVSHMTVSDVSGADTLPFLSYLLANDIAKVSGAPGKALYSCMLNEQGGVIDDLIVYYIDDRNCRMVTNAGTNEKDMAWIAKQAQAFDVTFEEKPDLALLAVQGPNALKVSATVLDGKFAKVVSSLARFQGAFHKDKNNDEQFVGRTGYTGEDGIELIVSAELAQSLWQKFMVAGVQPCGLGARDTLRLESGMSLYGNDLDEEHTPLESGLAWSVAKKDDRDFIGKTALAKPADLKMIGLVLIDRGVLRGNQKIMISNQEVGEITSGTFSPTLEKSIALARIKTEPAVKVGDIVQIAVRKRQLNAKVANFPFVKNGLATN